MGLSATVRDHFIVIVAGAFAAGAGLSWTVAEKVRVDPKNDEIARLEKTIASLKEENVRIAKLKAKLEVRNRELYEALAPTPEVLDALFGEDNWFVFPDHRDGLGVVRLREHFQVTPPVLYVDFGEARYKRGETVPGGGAATAKLTGSLGKSVYPPSQHKPLIRWEEARRKTRHSWFKAPEYEYVDPEKLDGLFGESNWKCDETFDFAIAVRRDKSFDVGYPFTAVDGPDNRKYGVGHTVPAGQSRVWLAGRLARSDCPS